MSLQEKINNDIKLAIKAKEVDKLAALRAAKSAIILEATKEGVSKVSDEISLKLIAKLVKQRKDSAAIFLEQKREDLAADEINQLVHLEGYLPEQLTEVQVREIVKKIISQVGASSSRDIGKCMQLLIQKIDGKANSSLISKLVKEELIG
tara:strand:- start:177 stop:626 length:450 start_codon:yes stop_codon:yes gene_type:complete